MLKLHIRSNSKFCRIFLNCQNNDSCTRIFRAQNGLTKHVYAQLRHYVGPIKEEKIIDLTQYPVERIRNFSIIAHVDHGKSTLADRLLEIAGTISAENKNKQVLDKLQVERERGITVKAQTASMLYEYHGEQYLLNLIDTPGHVDFNYEVARSLAACQGVILLVDANQGVQAQTMANFYLAFEKELVIIPVMNKIDLKVAKPEETQEQLCNVFDFDKEEILRISAKTGFGVNEVFKAVIEKIPPPTHCDINKPLKALIFDSSIHKFKGAVCNIAVADGTIKKGDQIKLHHVNKTFDVREVGIMYPDETPVKLLSAGQVGYFHGAIRNASDAQVGETIYHANKPVEPMLQFKPAVPMVFAGVFPMNQSEFTDLKTAIVKLLANDSSVSLSVDTSPALGAGFRLGFLGLLHMDVFRIRLEQEYDASVVVTSPSVAYKVKIVGEKNIKQYGGEMVDILNPCLMPPSEIITEYHEPMVVGTIITPDEYISQMNALIMRRRGTLKDQSYIDQKRLMYKVLFPLNEVVVDLFDELKSLTKGYASFDYEDAGYQISTLVKMDIVMNDKVVDEMALIVHFSRVREMAKRVVERLAKDIPRQMFRITIQAKVGGKVMAREDVKPFRKDVTAKCYGGDLTRKTKLLRKQAEGKAKMRLVGNVKIPKEAFINLMKR